MNEKATESVCCNPMGNDLRMVGFAPEEISVKDFWDADVQIAI